ncbi:ABC1-domain-containing protein [Auriculariales sp. MPI-PUGE-AT-0066]|nr:ABC1-domain-containing protein [Auriculariales sp. MPI-PUGE-AT-0066]
MGQAIGLQAALLPVPYQEAFSGIFDQAPTVPMTEVQETLEREFGKKADELFDDFDPVPVASASIGQVHRAKLNGQDVAVKVQKRAISKQVRRADVSQQMEQETDFHREARNAERAAEDFRSDPWLRSRIYVPKVYWERTSTRVMTAEWIGNASRLTDTSAIERRGFDTKEVMGKASCFRLHLLAETIIDTVISALSAQMFVFGFLHCDPHPGNVLIRPHPQDPRRHQTVLIDHGLYVELRPEFREQYADLWRSLLQGDLSMGFDPSSGNMFASAILLRPTRMRKKFTAAVKDAKLEEQTELTPEEEKKLKFERHQAIKARFKTFMLNEDLIPRELIFIGRVQRMMQANNQTLGSPSNRINLTAKWSLIGLQTSLPPLSAAWRGGAEPFFKQIVALVVFRVSLALIDISFRLTRLRQWWIGSLKRKGSGFEDLLDKQVRDLAKSELGVELHENAFIG